MSARATAVTALLLLGVLALSVPAAASDVRLARVGRFDQPLFVTAPPGDRDRIFVVQRKGSIRVVKDGATLDKPFLEVPGVSTGNAEQGLLSMAFAPDYASSGRFYVVYTDSGKDVNLVEYRRSASDPDRADPGTRRRVIRIRKSNPTHNAGQLQFGPDGLLYLSVGDGGCCGDTNNDAQRLGTLLGKILRIDPQAANGKPYTVPKANPFAKRKRARREIYAYGLRNPFRFSFDRKTGAIAIGDVGDVAPDGQEEIDYLPEGKASGANFGWNVFEGRRRNRSGNAPGAVRPVLVYSRAGLPCAVIGGYVVRDRANDALYGRYVYADSCSGRLYSTVLRPGRAKGRRKFARIVSPSSFGEDALGRVYVTSLAGDVYRLSAAGSSRRPSPAPLPETVKVASPRAAR